MKTLFKLFIPPIVFSLKRKLFPVAVKIVTKTEIWSGNYTNWQEAKGLCSGYDDNLILEKCKNALLQVKNGTAIYERDSVVFDEIQYSWGLLAGLQKAALENDGQLSVLDFGGSLGSTYFQNKDFLSNIKKLEWSIVEQENFVDCGKLNFETNQLRFYKTINECILQKQPNVLILSSVLQYLENPADWIEQFNNSKIQYILIDRTTSINQNSIITIQNVPETIYKATYPCWFFDKNFIENNLTNYSLIARFAGVFDPVNFKLNDNVLANWNGYLYKIR